MVLIFPHLNITDYMYYMTSWAHSDRVHNIYKILSYLKVLPFLFLYKETNQNAREEEFTLL